jgi:lysophospholipid acyltransferase (LPLAT)-like uncharacterized protein
MTPQKARWLACLVVILTRLVFLTVRLRVVDRSGFLDNPKDFPLIITFWHNRIMAVSLAFLRKYPKGRKGVSVLTSPSKDGEILAQVMAGFGMGAIRGSSSRRGSRALLECAKHLQSGADLAVTPDGPKGPRYSLGPGLILLAQKTDARIVPVHVRFHGALELKTWDGFRIPLPFSRVDVTIDTLQQIAPTPDEESFERERQRIESILRNETH